VRRSLLVTLVAALALVAAAPVAAAPIAASPLVKTYRFTYRTHDGRTSYALLLLPAWYGPDRHPAIPLVISPHGRNTTPASAASRWYELPATGGFAVVVPAGQGRRLQLYSWGYPGQIDDLAHMPALAERAVAFFQYRRHHVYAVGASMGAQEVLLLVATHPHLLAGAIAFDPAVDLANRYYEFAQLDGGSRLQAIARLEVGGTPSQNPQAYRLRSPSSYVRKIAFSNIPLELWWSTADEVIVNQATQAGGFYHRLLQINPNAPVASYTGTWRHAVEDTAFGKLPAALTNMNLLPPNPLAVQTPTAAAAAGQSA
jgi:pimeloyl-ACP methyl ester carboxylesterase